MDGVRSLTSILSGVILATLSLLIGVGARGLSGATVFDVTQYGAVGDGKADDTQAFAKAWAAATKQTGPVVLVVPAGKTFLVAQSNFAGPSSASPLTFQVLGTILSPAYGAWASVSDKGSWLSFEGVNNLNIEAPTGVVDGQGASWWPHACKVSKPPCYNKDAPAAVTIRRSQQVNVVGLTINNAARVHFNLDGCVQCSLTSVHISSAAESTENDGIHVSGSQHVTIDHANIASGDDCISIETGTSNMNMTNTNCGPGHGISIGSLGEGGSQATVEWVNVKNATFTGTSNGVRIKTTPGGSGYVRNVLFEGLQFNAVDNPIVVDQFYCDGRPDQCPEQSSAVQISGVSYVGATGTSQGDVAINIHCSSKAQCTGLQFQNLNLQGVSGKPVTASCTNAQGSVEGTVAPPVSCH